MPRNDAQARAEMERWQAMRRKEARRAAAVEAERPDSKFRDGEWVEIKGKAVVDHTEKQTGERTNSDHQGATGLILTRYWSVNWGAHVYTLKTEDGQVRGVPEHRLRRIRR